MSLGTKEKVSVPSETQSEICLVVTMYTLLNVAKILKFFQVLTKVTLQSIDIVRGKKILVVDDEPDVLEALEEILVTHDSLRNKMQRK